MSSVVGSDAVIGEKMAAEPAKPGNTFEEREIRCYFIFEGLGSRATSKVTFREDEGKQQTRLSAHPSDGERRPTSSTASSQVNQAPQHSMSDLKKKEDINPFKFSPDVDFCALSQMDKREKTQVRAYLLSFHCSSFD